MGLALCVVAKNATELAGWIAAHDLSLVDELVAIDNRGGRFGGYGHVVQRAFYATASSIFGICHADTLFRGEALRIFRDEAARGAVTGIVGRTMDSAYHWSKAGRLEGPTCLDGCAVFFRRDSGLDFDVKTFDGFHCVGEDIALGARMRGIPLVIPHADAEHASSKIASSGRRHEGQRARAKSAKDRGGGAVMPPSGHESPGAGWGGDHAKGAAFGADGIRG